MQKTEVTKLLDKLEIQYSKHERNEVNLFSKFYNAVGASTCSLVKDTGTCKRNEGKKYVATPEMKTKLLSTCNDWKENFEEGGFVPVSRRKIYGTIDSLLNAVDNRNRCADPSLKRKDDHFGFRLAMMKSDLQNKKAELDLARSLVERTGSMVKNAEDLLERIDESETAIRV